MPTAFLVALLHIMLLLSPLSGARSISTTSTQETWTDSPPLPPSCSQRNANAWQHSH